MIKIFYVYEVEGRKTPYIASSLLPDPWIREVRKYKKGREAKTEAIRRATGNELDSTLPVAEIDEFVSKNLYGTKKWNSYLKHRNDVEKEVHMVEYRTKKIYRMKIELAEEVEVQNIILMPQTCNLTDNADEEND